MISKFFNMHSANKRECKKERKGNYDILRWPIKQGSHHLESRCRLIFGNNITYKDVTCLKALNKQTNRKHLYQKHQGKFIRHDEQTSIYFLSKKSTIKFASHHHYQHQMFAIFFIRFIIIEKMIERSQCSLTNQNGLMLKALF